ncbi:PDZ domain-containing protein [uncultured Helicobacter sp.]|uniref:DUF7488 domain-containing protein n=1 Tax=uncultured Helicobacter sp. TaxID=175537 RepID=UPI00374F7BE1
MCLKWWVLYCAFVCSLCAQEYDYKHCVEYYKNASVAVGDTRAVALKHNGKVVYFLYARTPPKAKILKSDPFMGFYLIESKPTKLSYDLLTLDKRTLEDKNLVAISTKPPVRGHITGRQSSYLNYASFSNTLGRNSVIGNICYQIYGVGVGGKGFIERFYIERFLNAKEIAYSDIGVRLEPKRAVVALSDPFFPHNPFLQGDEILSINASKITSSTQAIWVITNLSRTQNASVQVRRSGKIHTFSIKPDRLYGGFLLSDTFLERFGITLDSNLMILTKTNALNRFKELKVGDRIVWINKTPATPNNLKELLTRTLEPQELSKYEGKIQLLVRRGEFEFFIKI